jgi:CheY-like chemotaxis protein
LATILAVDDEPAIRALLRAALEAAGHTVLEADDGACALEQARRHGPDLILLDLALPGMSGREVCRRLREAEATTAIPIVLLTGLPDAHRPANSQIEGVQGSLGKPFAVSELVEAVANLLAAGVSQNSAQAVSPALV